MSNLAIIMSGGSGSRIGSQIPKQFLKINGSTLIESVLETFNNHPEIQSIIIVSKEELIKKTELIVNEKKFNKVKKIIPGGSTRQISSRLGVFESDENYSNIIIHDAARPFITNDLIGRILNGLNTSKAVIPVTESTDTLISVSSDNFLKGYLNRNSIRRVQTPQGFKREIILKAHKLAEIEGINDFTDDGSMVIHFNISKVSIVKGEISNIKITYKNDIEKLNLEIIDK